MFFVYILECCDKTLYVGSTNDLEKRLHQHNHSKNGAHYTKIRRPVVLKYSKKCKTYAEARRREGELKKLTRSEKMTLINTQYLVVKKSKNGNGVFATKDFSKNEKIFKITGTLMTCDEDEDIDDETRANTYRYDADFYISPKGTLGNFFNHSCNPNVKIIKEKNTLFVVAFKKILKAEEITFDYSTITASDDVWEMKCNCGEKNCRKKIAMFESVPKKIKEKYMLLNIVPSYILKL